MSGGADPLEAARIKALVRSRLFGEPPEKITAGRFEVLGLVGSGGMGVVYAAHDPKLDRKVALKLLHPGGSGDRLLREAQALARLRHSNLVAVHEVGELDGRVFMAMELFEGETLRAWLREPRPLDRVVRAFAAAGRALAAAHRAGVLHRDFKPDNVLVGEGDEVRVVDFGLAAGMAEGSPGAPPASGGLASSLAGTPAYMAPEVLDGSAPGAASDQFSFCVTLYEALFGERPFSGEDARARKRAGQVSPPPAGRPVPGWLRRAVVRGLGADPTARWESMDALCDALARDPGRVRRRIALGAGAVVVVAAAAVVIARATLAERPCQVVATRWQGVWDAARRREVHDAFAASKLPYAEDSFKSVAAALDRQTAAIDAMAQDACVATRVRGAQTAAALDLRTACLAQRRDEVRALTDLLRQADRAVVERAFEAASALGSVQACADVQALQRTMPPPDAPVRARVDALRGELTRAKALADAGDYKRALAAAVELAAQAATVDYRPLRAEALLLLGDMQRLSGDVKTAEKTLEQAALEGEAARHDEVTARARVQLVHSVGVTARRVEDGHKWARLTEAALSRLGGNGPVEVLLLLHEATLYLGEEKYDRAHELLGRARTLAEKVHGVDSAEALRVQGVIATVYRSQGKAAEAIPLLEDVVARQSRVLGAQHPGVALTLGTQGQVLRALGRFDEALAAQQRVLAIQEAAYDPNHPAVANTHNDLANVYSSLARLDEAREHRLRALDIFERALGPRHPSVAMSLNGLGTLASKQNRLDEARDYYQRSLSINIETLGAEHSEVGIGNANLGDIAVKQKDGAAALERYRTALAIFEKAKGPDHPLVGHALTGIGRAHMLRKEAAAAIPAFERALAVREKAKVAPDLIANTKFGLADALWTAGRDKPRALGLAADAREVFAAAKGAAQNLAEVDAWLAKRRR